MGDISLTADQKKALEPHIWKFIEYTKTADYDRDQSERIAHTKFFREELPTRLAGLSEADITELNNQLWAWRSWTNTQWLAKETIAKTNGGIEKVKEELRFLLDSSRPIAERYDRFSNNVYLLGGRACLTEILCYIHPDRCGIWNRQSRTALKILGLGSIVNLNKYYPTAKDYEVFNQLLRLLSIELTAHGFKSVDLLMVDFFLYNVSQSLTPSTILPPATSPKSQDFDHDEIRDMVQQIGHDLGFEARTEVQIATGARVDVVWSARIANLGMVTYVFEVHKSGSIDSLILNLQKARRGDPTVQKVIAVSDDSSLEKIKKEISGLGSEFRESLGFWRVSDVERAGRSLTEVIGIIKGLGLAPSTSKAG